MVRGWNRWCRFWCLVFRLFASHSRTYLTAQVLGCFKREPIWTSVTVRCTSLHDTIELITLSQWDDFLLLISKLSKNLDPSHPRVPRVVPNNSHHLTSHYLVMVPICTLLSSNSDERNIPRCLFTCIRGKGPRSCWRPLIRACLNNLWCKSSPSPLTLPFLYPMFQTLTYPYSFRPHSDVTYLP